MTKSGLLYSQWRTGTPHVGNKGSIMKKIISTVRQILFAIVFMSAASVAQSQTFSLENPQPGSHQSGLSVFSGWSCSTNIQVLVDGVAYRAAAGTPRNGFPSTLCGGNSNVNFALLRNFNNFGAGSHTAQLVVDGLNAGSPVTFTVTVPVPSAPFATGLSSTVSVPDFPATGQTTTLTWQESSQNFAISGVGATIVPVSAICNPDTMSFRYFNDIVPGMTMDQVNRMIGCLGKVGEKGATWSLYWWRHADGTPNEISVYFDQAAIVVLDSSDFKQTYDWP